MSKKKILAIISTLNELSITGCHYECKFIVVTIVRISSLWNLQKPFGATSEGTCVVLNVTCHLNYSFEMFHASCLANTEDNYLNKIR